MIRTKRFSKKGINEEKVIDELLQEVNLFTAKNDIYKKDIIEYRTDFTWNRFCDCCGVVTLSWEDNCEEHRDIIKRVLNMQKAEC